MRGFGVLSRWAWLALCFGFGGCSNGSETPADPVSQACLDCLSEREKAGCAAQYSACEEQRSCDDYVLCQLEGLCFERAPGAGCEQEIGCKRPSDDAPDAGDAGAAALSPRTLAARFETCARTTCAATCGFVSK